MPDTPHEHRRLDDEDDPHYHIRRLMERIELECEKKVGILTERVNGVDRWIEGHSELTGRIFDTLKSNGGKLDALTANQADLKNEIKKAIDGYELLKTLPLKAAAYVGAFVTIIGVIVKLWNWRP